MEPYLLSTSYLPNIQYVSKLLSKRGALIDVHETYQKQSFRNRAVIYGANGPQDLVIPVKRPKGNRTKTCDILLDYDIPWMDVHWKAILSAYKHSPFFEIFEEEIHPFYEKNYKYLVDWNHQLIEGFLDMTGTKYAVKTSPKFIAPNASNPLDQRNTIHPKPRMQKPDPEYTPPVYQQVFEEKHGFQANLSFIDLLFNEGPNATYRCRRALKKGNS